MVKFLIIKNIFKVHYLFYLGALISAILGYFKPFILISLLIIVHEFGHFLVAFYYKWRIKEVIIFPFGGVTVFNEYLNKPLKEEFLILIMGPLFQIIFYYLLTFLFGYNDSLRFYNYLLLSFNLLPIYPLDGYRLINLILNFFLPFKISHIISLIISLIFIIIISLNLNFIFSILMFILFIKNIQELKNHKMIFNKFIIERYLNNFKFKKTKIIKGNNFNKIKRDYKHLFLINKKYYLEDQILKEKFDFH